MSLPQALQPLASYNQFVTYITRPSATRPGKIDKLPTDHRNGQVCDAQDPAVWCDYETAYAKGNGMVGFVFTDNDPFWFLDIDACAVNGQWSPLALELCTLFAGCATEVSISGTGLHIIGTGKVPKHKTRDTDGLGLEFYHNKRFMALGGRDGVTGNALHNAEGAVATLVDRYFKRGEEAELSTDWTTEPCADWVGSVNDDDLIRRACNAKSSASVFGIKASFADLWLRDVSVLSKAFPDDTREFNASGADASLAQHLAFWTGKDCVRMERLMRASGLMRDKYNNHEKYLRMTITQAVAKQASVCVDKSTITAIAPIGVHDVEGSSILTTDNQKILFENCAYVQTDNKIFMPGGHALNQERFDNMLGGYTFVVDAGNSKMSKSAWDAFTQSQSVRFNKVVYATFRPDLPPGHIFVEGMDRCVNSYWPIKVKSMVGNVRPFKDHLERILPNQQDQAIVLAYMAAVVQYPGVKFQWCPLIQGVEGNGKTLLSRCVAEAVGRKHCHYPKASEIGEKYNDWLENKIFIGVEDIYVPKEKREIMEILKPMITSDELEIRRMATDKTTKKVCCNFIMNSNHKDAILKTKNDRRFAIFYCAQQQAGDLKRDNMDGNYFPALYNWLKVHDGYAMVTEYLQTYPIPDELNPAKTCHRAPITSSTAEAISQSLGTLEQEIAEAVLGDKVGFRDGWISTHFLDELIRNCGAVKVPRNKRRDMLLDMGYIVHPGLLPTGQVPNVVSPDGCKPRLFVKADHHTLKLQGAAITRRYSEAQVDHEEVRLKRIV